MAKQGFRDLFARKGSQSKRKLICQTQKLNRCYQRQKEFNSRGKETDSRQRKWYAKANQRGLFNKSTESIYVTYCPSTEPSIKRRTSIYKRKNSETGAHPVEDIVISP